MLSNGCLRLVALGAVLMLGAAGGSTARADVLVYQQASDYTAGAAFNFFTSGYGVDGAASRGFQTFDNFTLSSAAQLDRLTFQVAYWDYQNTANNPVLPDTTTWQVSIYANSGGAPGASLFSQSLPAAQVSSTLAGTALLSDGSVVGIYDVSFQFTGTFAANAGTTYWISPFSLQSSFNPVAGWMSGTGGDGNSYQNVLGPGQAVTSGGAVTADRALGLFAVPEPMSAALFGIGSLVLIVVGRRRPGLSPIGRSTS
jgi:hypothetical protein